MISTESCSDIGKMTKGDVLIVDDDPTNLRLLSGMLTKKGYKVRPAPSGTLALISVQSTLPDIVLLDIKMPEMDGYEVCRRLKADEKTCHVPILFISALSEVTDMIKGFGVGGVDYITRPFQREEILARINTHISLARMYQRVEERLNISEEFNKSLIENAPNPIITINPDTSISYVNPALEDLTGFTSKELIGVKTPYPFWRKDLIEQIQKDIEKAMREGFNSVEEPFQKKSGEDLWVEITSTPVLRKGKLYYYLANWVDITDRKLSEEKLKASEYRYRTLVNAMNEGLVEVDKNWRITFVNDKFIKIIGFSRDKLIGCRFYELASEKHLAKAKKELKLRLQGLTGSYELELIGAGRKKIYTLCSPNPSYDLKGNYLGGVGVVSDITERKQAEKKIKASLKEKDVLLREIHHRVKNNMQVISSLLKLQAYSVKNELVSEVLMDCQGRVRAMALVHETLYGSDRLSSVDFRAYIPRVANKIFQSHSEGKDRIKLKVDAEDIKLGIEQATPLGLIFSELISNSLKYAFSKNQHGEIFVSLRIVEQDTVEFIFSDSGIGIPEDLDWRNTNSLGLQLIIPLAEDQLDGTVNLNRDNGTRFTIKFSLEENK